MLEFFLSLPLLAQAQQERGGNAMQTIIMFALAILFFYFILWRPERKRRKALEAQRSSMKTGDRVTAMGIVGTIDQIKDNTVVLKMIDGSKIEVLKQAISEVQGSGEANKEPTQNK